MGKTINWGNFSKGFGESFLYALENERRRQQQQEQFNKEMAFSNRQLDFNMGIAEKNYQLDQDKYDLDKQQEERLGVTAKIDIMKSLTPSEEGGSGAMTGADWEKQTGQDLYPTEKEKDFYSLFQEAVPTTKEVLLDTKNEFGIREYIYGDPDTKEVTKIDRTTIPSDILNPKSNKLEDKFSGYYNSAVSHLAELKSIYNMEGNKSKNYVSAKQKATESLYNALQESGLTNVRDPKTGLDILDALRENVKDLNTEGYEEKRKLLNDAINKFDQTYKLTPEQLKVLKLWSEIGTR